MGGCGVECVYAEVVAVGSRGMGDALPTPLDTTTVVPSLIRIPLMTAGNLLDRHARRVPRYPHAAL